MFTLLLDAVNPTSCNSEFFIWNDLELFCTFCCLFVSSKLLFIQGGHQFWALTPAGEVRRDEACLDHDGGPGPPVPPLLPIFLFVCRAKSLWCFVMVVLGFLCFLSASFWYCFLFLNCAFIVSVLFFCLAKSGWGHNLLWSGSLSLPRTRRKPVLEVKARFVCRKKSCCSNIIFLVV